MEIVKRECYIKQQKCPNCGELTYWIYTLKSGKKVCPKCADRR